MTAPKKKAMERIERIGMVNILGQSYAIKRVGKIAASTTPSGLAYEAVITNSIRTIYISRLAVLRTEDELILHEILHGVVAALGVQATEAAVASIARGLWEAGVRWHTKRHGRRQRG